MLRQALVAVAAVLAFGAAPVRAQEGPAGPPLQTLLELAHAIGEAHAIQTLCNGDGDQTWRDYMMKLLELEAPANPRRSQLSRAFNTGYRQQSAKRSSCTSDLVSEQARIAARGRALAESVVRDYLQ